MRIVDQNGRITRRGFFERGARAVAGAGLLATGNSANAANLRATEAVDANAGPMPGKIALEEHFVIPETLAASYGAPGSPEFQRRLEDIGSARIAEMDRGGLDDCVLSLVGEGIQAIPNVSEDIRIAQRANDHLAEEIAKSSKRFKGFAVCRSRTRRPRLRN
jgi:predicted TIM-barrel fold metal-dependent hydrolase